MLAEIAFATVVVAANPTPTPQGLPITGVSVEKSMPSGVTHIEAPPFRAYRTQSLMAPTASPSPEVRPPHHR